MGISKKDTVDPTTFDEVWTSKEKYNFIKEQLQSYLAFMNPPFSKNRQFQPKAFE